VSFANGSIAVGHPSPFELVTERHGFGVYKLHPRAGADTFVVAQLPSKRTTEFVPSTVIEPFTDLESAESALNRWAADPQPPRPPRKLKAALGAHRRNGHKPKFKDDGFGQLFLNLQPVEREAEPSLGIPLPKRAPERCLTPK
jgi:hypothetical protein